MNSVSWVTAKMSKARSGLGLCVTSPRAMVSYDQPCLSMRIRTLGMTDDGSAREGDLIEGLEEIPPFLKGPKHPLDPQEHVAAIVLGLAVRALSGDEFDVVDHATEDGRLHVLLVPVDDRQALTEI